MNLRFLDDDVPLKKGDRVVWISDAGPVSGVVRWFLWHDKGQLNVGVSLVSNYFSLFYCFKLLCYWFKDIT